MPETPDPNDEGPKREDFLRPFFTEPGLQIVLVTGVVVIGSFFVWMLVLALRTRSLPAMAAIGITAVMSAEAVRAEYRRRGRPGPVALLIGGTWLICVGVAWAAVENGWL